MKRNCAGIGALSKELERNFEGENFVLREKLSFEENFKRFGLNVNEAMPKMRMKRSLYRVGKCVKEVSIEGRIVFCSLESLETTLKLAAF